MWATQNPTDKNPKPRHNPLDFYPNNEIGNLRVNTATMKYDVLTGEALAAAKAAGKELYISHFVTCPARKEFRQSRNLKK